MKIHVITEKASKNQILEMMETHETYFKIAVDIERDILAGGGEFHADCEAYLLECGCKQENIWGADWIPTTQEIRFEALMNIRPKQKNPSMKIIDESIRNKVQIVTRKLLAGA